MSEFESLENINEVISSGSKIIDDSISRVVESFESQKNIIKDAEAEIGECFSESEPFDIAILEVLGAVLTEDAEFVKDFSNRHDSVEQSLDSHESEFLKTLFNTLVNLHNELFKSIQVMPELVKNMIRVIEGGNGHKGLLFINQLLEDDNIKLALRVHIFEKMGVPLEGISFSLDNPESVKSAREKMESLKTKADPKHGGNPAKLSDAEKKQWKIYMNVRELKGLSKRIIEIKNGLKGEEEETKKADAEEMDEDKMIQESGLKTKDFEQISEKQKNVSKKVHPLLDNIKNNKKSEEDTNNTEQVLKEFEQLYSQQKNVMDAIYKRADKILTEWRHELESCDRIHGYAEALIKVLKDLNQLEQKLNSNQGLEEANKRQEHLEKITEGMDKIKMLNTILQTSGKEILNEEKFIFKTVDQYLKSIRDELEESKKEIRQEHEFEKKEQEIEKRIEGGTAEVDKMSKQVQDLENVEKQEAAQESGEKALLDGWKSFIIQINEGVRQVLDDASLKTPEQRMNAVVQKLGPLLSSAQTMESVKKLVNSQEEYVNHLEENSKKMGEFINSFEPELKGIGQKYAEFKKMAKESDNKLKAWINEQGFFKIEDVEAKADTEGARQEQETKVKEEKIEHGLDSKTGLGQQPKEMLAKSIDDFNKSSKELGDNANELRNHEQILKQIYNDYTNIINDFENALKTQTPETAEMEGSSSGGFLGIFGGQKAGHEEQAKKIKDDLVKVHTYNSELIKKINGFKDKIHKFVNEANKDKNNSIALFCDLVVFNYAGLSDLFIGTNGLIPTISAESSAELEELNALLSIDDTFEKWTAEYDKLLKNFEEEIQKIENEDVQKKATTMFDKMRTELTNLFNHVKTFDEHLVNLRNVGEGLKTVIGSGKHSVEELKQSAEAFKQETGKVKTTKQRVKNILEDYYNQHSKIPISPAQGKAAA